MNIGAQKCVIQRVRKSAGSATSRGFMPAAPKKSRVWSSAITIMTRPRRRSTESRRTRAAVRAVSTEGAAVAAGVARSNATELMCLASPDPQVGTAGRGGRTGYFIEHRGERLGDGLGDFMEIS